MGMMKDMKTGRREIIEETGAFVLGKRRLRKHEDCLQISENHSRGRLVLCGFHGLDKRMAGTAHRMKCSITRRAIQKGKELPLGSELPIRDLFKLETCTGSRKEYLEIFKACTSLKNLWFCER